MFYYLVLYPKSFDSDFFVDFFCNNNISIFNHSLIGVNPHHVILHLMEGEQYES